MAGAPDAVIIPAFLATLGSAAIVALYLRDSKKEEEWYIGKRVANGTLTRCEQQEEGTWSEVEYRVSNARYRITGDFEHTPADVGKSVVVAYDPASPSEARVLVDRTPRLDVGSVVLFVVLWIAFFIAAMAIRAFVV